MKCVGHTLDLAPIAQLSLETLRLSPNVGALVVVSKSFAATFVQVAPKKKHGHRGVRNKVKPTTAIVISLVPSLAMVFGSAFEDGENTPPTSMEGSTTI